MKRKQRAEREIAKASRDSRKGGSGAMPLQFLPASAYETSSAQSLQGHLAPQQLQPPRPQMAGQHFEYHHAAPQMPKRVERCNKCGSPDAQFCGCAKPEEPQAVQLAPPNAVQMQQMLNRTSPDPAAQAQAQQNVQLRAQQASAAAASAVEEQAAAAVEQQQMQQQQMQMQQQQVPGGGDAARFAQQQNLMAQKLLAQQHLQHQQQAQSQAQAQAHAQAQAQAQAAHQGHALSAQAQAQQALAHLQAQQAARQQQHAQQSKPYAQVQQWQALCNQNGQWCYFNRSTNVCKWHGPAWIERPAPRQPPDGAHIVMEYVRQCPIRGGVTVDTRHKSGPEIRTAMGRNQDYIAASPPPCAIHCVTASSSEQPLRPIQNVGASVAAWRNKEAVRGAEQDELDGMEEVLQRLRSAAQRGGELAAAVLAPLRVSAEASRELREATEKINTVRMPAARAPVQRQPQPQPVPQQQQHQQPQQPPQQLHQQPQVAPTLVSSNGGSSGGGVLTGGSASASAPAPTQQRAAANPAKEQLKAAMAAAMAAAAASNST